MYVSRGMHDVYRRLFCDPEMTVITLHRATATDSGDGAYATRMLTSPPDTA